MISLKPGARITGLRNEALFAVYVAYSIYADEGYDMIITSGTDGSHSRGSEHYKGDAFDLRTRHLGAGEAEKIRDMLASALGSEFDVVLESTHIHVEFDPKRGINK
jgi:hypothetical protein